jgi:lantibiotic leader peptide-processing serine protease
MRTRYLVIAVATLGAAAVAPATIASGAATEDDLAALCDELWSSYAETPTAEPLAGCQWDMAMIGANDDTFTRATGKGVRVGVIDSGVDITHPDIAPNLDLDASCSFITLDDPLALDVEKAGGDCSNKDAVQDYGDHGTHVASTIAAPINGIGIAGVAPEATIVALKACSAPVPLLLRQ